MANVFVGRPRLGTGEGLVAIKRPHPHLAESPEIRALLAREARLGRMVRHPNVVATHEIEEHDGQLILVMPYVEGATLAELSEANAAPIDLPVALVILADVSAGLAALHGAAGADGEPLALVHGDVSPHNVLVGADGTSAVFDLGLANGGDFTPLPSAGTRGTLAYAAPECVHGEPPTDRSDVFSLGVVAWEAITGRRLFAGSSHAATLTAIVEQPAPALCDVAPVDDELSTIVAAALIKDPAARVTSAELADLLAQYARGSAHAADPNAVARLVNRLWGARLAARRAVLRAAPSR